MKTLSGKTRNTAANFSVVRSVIGLKTIINIEKVIKVLR
jgi:hypothetical protein